MKQNYGPWAYAPKPEPRKLPVLFIAMTATAVVTLVLAWVAG